MQEYTVRVYNDRTEWYQNGQLHRINGPAIEWANGAKSWWQKDLLHRLDGPAIEWATGDKEWFQNGQLHRLDGPAVELADGYNEWYIEGEELTRDEFNQRVNPQQVELTLDQIAQQFGIPVGKLKIKK
jgi:hypothetical protein